MENKGLCIRIGSRVKGYKSFLRLRCNTSSITVISLHFRLYLKLNLLCRFLHSPEQC